MKVPPTSTPIPSIDEFKSLGTLLPYHTYLAYYDLLVALQSLNKDSTKERPVHLDLYCGTGMSSQVLADDYTRLGSSAIVVGVDRSFDRLSRGGMFKGSIKDPSDASIAANCNVRTISNNCIMVRADVPSLMSMYLNSRRPGLTPFPNVVKTTIFYPNPYPKSRSYNSRFYGEPWFLGYRLEAGGEVEVRSNWETLCMQALDVWKMGGMGVEGVEGVLRRVEEGGDGGVEGGGGVEVVEEGERRVSLFERKYFDVGERCFKVTLT
ncbi:hypothetical protein TrRE_jg10437 [Triparma retinervis]|uniref:Methyltransferase domain-containing protein n=1 Tax=Triparma retinervis TaxID=2557542 RepID=A0A9W7A1U7_9STRA|nr:hypothetical protein TrRE_jg10437 [Triparma retinervis]